MQSFVRVLGEKMSLPWDFPLLGDLKRSRQRVMSWCGLIQLSGKGTKKILTCRKSAGRLRQGYGLDDRGAEK